jgi:hypothetical protein
MEKSASGDRFVPPPRRVLQEAFAGEKGGFIREVLAPEHVGWKCGLQPFDRSKPDRDLR